MSPSRTRPTGAHSSPSDGAPRKEAPLREAPLKEAPLLPPARDSDRPLFFVVAIIVALACTAAIAARSAWSAADAWTAGLDGAMTVQVRTNPDPSTGDPSGNAPSSSGNSGGNAADMTARAESALRSVAGVTSARALTPDDLDALLKPWFGDEGAPAGVPLPILIDVQLDTIAPASAADLASALERAGLDADVDDHESWARDLRRAAGAARTLALSAFALLIAAAIAVTSFATRASLAVRADVVEVLHLVGADDTFIASEFTRRFLGLGVRAGFLGAVLAFAAALAAFFLTRGGGDDFLPSFRFARLDVIILALTPLVSATVAAFTARETVLRTLKRLF